jgi:hypothetical protein
VICCVVNQSGVIYHSDGIFMLILKRFVALSTMMQLSGVICYSDGIFELILKISVILDGPACF